MSSYCISILEFVKDLSFPVFMSLGRSQQNEKASVDDTEKRSYFQYLRASKSM
jgi:hypothetical protein